MITHVVEWLGPILFVEYADDGTVVAQVRGRRDGDTIVLNQLWVAPSKRGDDDYALGTLYPAVIDSVFAEGWATPEEHARGRWASSTTFEFGNVVVVMGQSDDQSLRLRLAGRERMDAVSADLGVAPVEAPADIQALRELKAAGIGKGEIGALRGIVEEPGGDGEPPAFDDTPPALPSRKIAAPQPKPRQ